MFRLSNISKIIDNNHILKNINLNIPSTGLIVIIGENGAGKSTLLNIIGGLDQATFGTIYFDNQDISTFNERQLTIYREQYISFIFQNPNLFENTTVIENIKITEKDNNIDDLLQQLNISHLKNEKVKKLSGGEKQKVAIVRGINKKSKILLADEPTSSLDYEMKEKVFSILKEISKQRLIIMVTHEIDLIRKYADMIIEMQNGEIKNIYNSNFLGNYSNQNVCINKFNTFKFTIQNLFVNKKKIIISSILMIFSFIFILLSTSFSSLNILDMHKDILSLEQDQTVFFQKMKKEDENNFFSLKYFLEEDINYIKQKIDFNQEILIGKTMGVNGVTINFSIPYIKDSTSSYYQHVLTNKLSFLDEKYLKKVDYGLFPTQDNEIVISSYLADQMIKFGVMNEKKEYYKPQNYQEIIQNKEKLILGSSSVIISGIYQLDLAENKNFEIDNVFSEKVSNLAGNIYVTDNFFSLFDNTEPTINKDLIFKVNENPIRGKGEYLQNPPTIFQNNNPVLLINNNLITSLNTNEIIVNSEILNKLGMNIYNCIGQEISIMAEDSFISSTVDTLKVRIVGISNNDNYYMSKEILSNVLDKKIYINKIFLTELDSDKINKLFYLFPTDNNEVIIRTNYSQCVKGFMGFISFVSNVFKIITPIFILLSFVILSNYIINSIDLHQKDISILKAFGINEKKTKKIFIYEILILIISSFVVSLIIFLFLKYIINYITSNLLMFKVNIVPIQLFYILFTLIITIIFIFLISIIIHKKMKKSTPQKLHKIN